MSEGGHFDEELSFECGLLLGADGFGDKFVSLVIWEGEHLVEEFFITDDSFFEPDEQVTFGGLVLVEVGQGDVNNGALFVWQFGEHLCLGSSYHACLSESLGEFV